MKVNITPKQFDALHAALLGAFRLEEMELLLLRHRIRLEDLTVATTRELAFGKVIDGCDLRGMLPDFVMWAADARPQDLILRALADEIRIMTLASPLQERRDALIRMLDQKVSDSVLHEAYRRFAPPGRENELQAFRAADVAAVAVYTLADATRQEGRYPLIELAIHFQNIVDAVTRKKLEQWVHDAFEVHGANEQARHAVAKRVETGEEPYDLYLQVIVERLRRPSAETMQYDVEVRRQKVLQSGVVLEPESLGSYTPLDADEVFELVREFVTSHEAERAHVESFSVEMVLDHRDLALPADQIAPRHPAPMAIGAECDVLLRSWDRHFGDQKEALQLDWREVWSRHVAQPAARLCDAEFFDHLTFRARLKAESASCLLVDFVPPGVQYSDEGPIWTMLTGGTPVAVWARPDMSDDLLPAFAAFLRHLQTCPMDWKKHVRTSRLAAAGTRNRHFGRHLCFLFDDGNRPVINEGFDQ